MKTTISNIQASATDATQLDVTAPDAVEVMIRQDGRVVWVNVNGVCMFRACQIGIFQLTDERKE